MKKSILILLLSILIVCCNSNKSASFPRQPNDTVSYSGLYRSLITNLPELGVMAVVFIDTFDFTQVDSLTQKKKWFRNKYFYLPFTDTVRNRITLRPELDSTGKAKTFPNYYPVLPSRIYGYIPIDIDSLNQTLNDTTKKK